MASTTAIINPIDPSVIDDCDPDFLRLYNKYQGPRLAAHHVPYEVFHQDRAKYSVPTSEIEGDIAPAASITLHKIQVTTPPGEITIQVIKPTAAAIARSGLQKDGLLPAYIDFHGGGFVIGTLATDLGFCQNVAHNVGCIAVNVAYRLAPAFPHPTPATDSLDALKWVAAHAPALGIDRARLAVGGFSAGACLAAAVALMARDDDDHGGGDDDDNNDRLPLPPLRLQLLVVPLVDCRFVPEDAAHPPVEASLPYPSYVRLERAPCLPLARIVWFYNLWLGRGEVRRANAADFRASPLLAASHAGLAPASIHCAGLDPLVDEGRRYWEVLRAAEGGAAGTRKKSTLTVYPGVGHPFAHWTRELPAAWDFLRNVYGALTEAFAVA